MLGRYLVEGAAGESNYQQGVRWLELAAAQGILDAQNELSKLSSIASRKMMNG